MALKFAQNPNGDLTFLKVDALGKMMVVSTGSAPTAIGQESGALGALTEKQLKDAMLSEGLVLANTHITETLFVGVTGSTTGGFPLLAGESVPVSVSNANLLFLYSVGASSFSWIGS